MKITKEDVVNAWQKPIPKAGPMFKKIQKIMAMTGGIVGLTAGIIYIPASFRVGVRERCKNTYSHIPTKECKNYNSIPAGIVVSAALGALYTFMVLETSRTFAYKAYNLTFLLKNEPEKVSQ